MKKIYINIIAVFSLAGFLFSGYLTYNKMVLGSCPLSEGCPYFWGYPACVYGFILFTALFLVSLFLLPGKYNQASLMKTVFWISVLGMIFAGYTSAQELIIQPCIGGNCKYSLLLPTCVYGFVMYAVIFVYSALALYKK